MEMKRTTKSVLFLGMMFCINVAIGQNITVTFTAAGEVTSIDSVKATNLNTNQSITLPGNATLVLSQNSGIPTEFELTGQGRLFPNPFAGRATVSCLTQNPQTVYIKMVNIFGQVVAHTRAFAQPGENEFAISVNHAGNYSVSVTTDQGTTSYKVVCTQTDEAENKIQYCGILTGKGSMPLPPGTKSSETIYILGFSDFDLIQYKCFSGAYSTILTDMPLSSTDYIVEFFACTDLGGRSYTTVGIGRQIWMAENLAYLPAVSSSFTGSNVDRYYYVYGYEGDNVSEAKGTENYNTYGVLYNWPAAKASCPAGWHLPSSADWDKLTDLLGNYGAGKIKESGFVHWLSPNMEATNSSGFTALPGGTQLYLRGYFQDLGRVASFWSSTEFNQSPETIGWQLTVRYNDNLLLRNIHEYSFGLSVRCLKDL